jgi:hypothetical protein
LLRHLVLYGRLQSVTIPDAVTTQYRPPEDEHSIARNMSRIVMYYIYYRIKELCIKLVIGTSLYCDARSEKHQTSHTCCSDGICFWSLYRLFRCFWDHAAFIFRVKF